MNDSYYALIGSLSATIFSQTSNTESTNIKESTHPTQVSNCHINNDNQYIDKTHPKKYNSFYYLFDPDH